MSSLDKKMLGAALCVALLACEGTVSGPSETLPDREPSADEEVDVPPDDPARLSTHAAALAVMESRCTQCHDSEPLDLAGGNLDEFVDRLVARPSSIEDCGGESLVDPNDVSRSLMVTLTASDAAGTACISRMPLGTSGLEAGEHAVLTEWVQLLVDVYTERQEPVEPVDPPVVRSDLAEPDDPLRVLTKAKYLLTGGAVSGSELDRATDANGALAPAAYESLVREWMETGEFTEKRWRFLELALEQNPADSNYTRQLRNSVGVTAAEFTQNLEETMLRTAERIYQSGGDFRTVFYTDRQEVTTATLMMLKMLDNPALRSVTGVIRKEHAVNNLRTYISEHYDGTDDPQLVADTTDWRTVELRYDPNITEMRRNEEFEDGTNLSTLRDIPADGAVTLRTPRTLCSSPAFFQMWQTNADNRFRAQVNQCLMMALGHTFSTVDPTEPDIHPLPGIYEAEIPAGSECMGCHKNMDPMLAAYEAHFDYDNQRYLPHTEELVDWYIEEAARVGNYTPGSNGRDIYYEYLVFPEPYFSFRGTNTPSADLRTFIREVVDHPDFASAWAMKVCQWSTSIRCDRGDPELMRVTEAFADSGYRLDVLFETFFTSKLLTHTYGASETSFPGAQVSIARRDHYCQALRVRLQAVRDVQELGTTRHTDICGSNRKLSEGVPDGVVQRGSPDFNLPWSSSTFSNISISSLCSDQRDLVANNRTFDPREPEIAIPLMVEHVLGFPAGTERYAEALAALNQVFSVFREDTVCADASAFESALTEAEPSCGLDLSAQDAMVNVFSFVCQDPALTVIGL